MKIWKKHLIFWLAVYVLWTHMKTGGCLIFDDLIVSVVHVLSYMSIFYLLTKVQIPKFYNTGKVIIFVLSILVSTVTIVFLWHNALITLSSYIKVHPTTLPESSGKYILEAIQMYVPGMILLAWESFESKQDEEERLHRLEKESLSNELNYLKAQLNPEFLFNTLENLKTFVKENSSKAPDMILRLSEILDYVLYRSQREKLPIREEIDVIEGFLALEKLRLDEKLEVQLIISGDTSVQVSPLVLLSLVENILKESVLKSSSELQVTIKISINKTRVNCNIEMDKESPYFKHDIGLADVRRQLLLSYPDRHVLHHSTDESTISTSLTLMLEE